jgi:hypothetical protein
MDTSIIILILICIGLVSLYISGFFNVFFHTLLQVSYERHKKLRRNQRPTRVFLVRHGQSQANVDTSKIAFFILKLNSCFL